MSAATSNDSAIPATETAQATADGLVRHQKRPGWGCGMLVWNRGGKRAYQFEDGKRRVFAGRYCNMLKPVDRPLNELNWIRSNLAAAAGREVTPVSTPTHEAIPLLDQVDLFLSKYGLGFRDEAWISAKRGIEGKRPLKRHRDALIAEAKRLLGRDALDSMIDAGRHPDVIDAMVALTDVTDLVTVRHVRGLSGTRGANAVDLAESLRDMLYGNGEFAIRFERFIASMTRVLGKTPSWQLASLFAAAVHPTEHLFVKPGTTDAQACWMAPGFAMTKAPTAAGYDRLRGMAMSLGERLGESSLAPRDLLDLHDFMWETLRPKAREEIAARRKARRNQDAS